MNTPENSILVQQIIPLTIQGEGYHSGKLASFIRLYGCPVNCHFCDSGYSKDKTATYEKMSLMYIDEQLESFSVVITGGEPTVNPSFELLLQYLLEIGYSVAIETSGIKWKPCVQRTWITLSPKEHLTQFIVSPEYWVRANELKLIVTNQDSIDYYQDKIEYFLENGAPVFFQPEWNTKEETRDLILENLSRYHGVKLSLQTHKYWGIG